jgi:4-amino-4-deoxy-L-arabinose transferase-like glycosyltransferase
VGSVVATAAALRVASLTSQSFSQGETAYVLAARSDPWHLHGLLLRAAASLFGAGDAALRAPSALAGVAAVPVLYALVQRLASRELALAAAAALALAPLHVAASVDARPWALALFLGLSALAIAARAAGAAARARLARLGDRLRAGVSGVPEAQRAAILAACAVLVPVAAAALASATWRPQKADWRAAATAVEARVRAEDLLVFEGARTEAAYLRYALRADDRVALGVAPPLAAAQALSGRGRAWLVLSDAGREAALRHALPGGWREADRVYARGVQAVLLARPSNPNVEQARAGGE